MSEIPGNSSLGSTAVGDVLLRIDAGWSPLCDEDPPGPGQWGVLKVSAITSGRYLPEESKALATGMAPRPDIEVKRGDIIMCRANGAKDLVGSVALVPDPPARLMLSDKTLRLVADPTIVDSTYLYHYLTSWHTKAQVARLLNGGTGQNNISQDCIRSIKIIVPALDEQRRVAEILDSVDADISASSTMIGKLESVSSALVAERLALLIQSVREFVPLNSVAAVLSGVTLGSEPSGLGSIDVPYLRVANVQDGYVDTTEMKTVRILRSELPRYLLRKGDVLLTEGGDLDKLGRGAMWDGRVPECICQNHIFRVRCDESEILPEYLSLYTGSPMGKAYFLSIAKQTTNLASINSTQLKHMPLPVPRLSDQSALVDLITSCTAALKIEQQRLGKLRQIKQGLMDDLLTGRVRVPVESLRPD
jgi:type I restriction enzyme, S subunit